MATSEDKGAAGTKPARAKVDVHDAAAAACADALVKLDELATAPSREGCADAIATCKRAATLMGRAYDARVKAAAKGKAAAAKGKAVAKRRAAAVKPTVVAARTRKLGKAVVWVAPAGGGSPADVSAGGSG